MDRREKKSEYILKGVVIGLLCLVLLVGGILCLTWGGNVPEQGSVQAEETSAPPPETVAATDAVDGTVPDGNVPAEEPEDVEEEPTRPEASKAEKPTLPAPDREETDAPESSQPTTPAPDRDETDAPESTQPTTPAPDQGETDKNDPPEETVPAETEPPVTEPEEVVYQAAGQVNAENNVVTEDTSFSDNGVSAQVPAGVLLEENTTELVLTITEKDSSDSGVALEAGQAMRPLDVHIQGVSQENTEPIAVCLGKVLPGGMNIGNVTLYHVENGAANPMTQVLTMTDLDTHNEFYYDPVTGDTTVAMASFSEVAVVSEDSAWEGKFDTSWYNTTDKEFTIANADQLAGFGQIVGGMAEGIERDSFSGKTVKLTADVNLADKESENNENLIFYPIGYYYIADQNGDENTKDPYSTVYSFEGTFDGQGHTIKNFYQNTWEMKGDDPYYDLSTNHYYNDAMGLFGYVVNGKVMNLTVDNFSSDGEFTPTGVIAAYAANSTFENIAITNCNPRVYNTGNGGIVGIGGNSDDTETLKLTFTNITIDNTNKISALWGSWDVACGGLVGMFRGAGHVYMTNCHVAAQIDVYNDVCGNYQYYWYRYSGMLVGTNKNMTTDENGYTVPETTKFHAENCTVHFGQWNDYYYCELVANSLASYTHDHQFSRLEQISSLDEIKSGDTWTKTGNFLLISGDTKTCYHIVNDNGTLKQHLHTDAGEETVNGETVLKEDKAIVYLPFNQLFTGYGWGVKHVPIYNDDTPNPFAGVTILDRDVADSVTKFEKAATAKDSYTTDSTVTIGELFAAVENTDVAIDIDNVQVFVSPVGETSTAGGTYTANTTEWEQGTLTFTGLGAATISITDYNFCKTTTINVTITEPVAVDKFEKTEITSVTAGDVYLGDLFDAVDGVTIDSANVSVTVSGVEYEYKANTEDWTQSSITFKSTGTASITISEGELCNDCNNSVSVVENESFTTVLPNTAKYLYRVGNDNAVALGKLFKATDGATINGTVEVSAASLIDDTTVLKPISFDKDSWTTATMKFDTSFTGPVAVTIDAVGAEPYTLNLEVVDATNVTTASFSGNTVLLNDVSTSSSLSTSGVIYGNGFTVNMENAPITEKNGAVFHLYDGAILKNLNIVGKEFTSVSTTVNDTNYGVSAVRAWGTVVIENCYISGCRAAVSVTGTELTIKDSVIANGVYANVDFRSGILNLHNVTTINEPHTVDNTTIVGLGIVGNMTASAGRQLNITGTLTQYNWVSQDDCSKIKASGVSGIFNSVFTEDQYSAFRYTYDGTTYVNTGILSLCNDFGASAATGVPSNYSGESVSATIGGVSADGYVWAPGRAETLTAEDMKYHDTVYVHTSNDQGTSYIPSAFSFTNTDLEVEDGVVQISYESGSSYTLSNETLKALFAAKKYGKDLPYTISMDGSDYTNSDIVFDATASQTYTITYTITDNLVYGKDGSLKGKTYEVIKELKVFATVVDKGADAPTFTFYYGTNGSASAGTPHTTQPTNSYTSTIKQVGEAYYIMPNVTATTANAIGSQTVNGETVYYPIVDGINVRSGNTTDYDFTRYYPIFKAVTISDNGTEYSYSGTKDIPPTVAWVEATIDTGNGASALNDGFGLYNNQYLCKIQTKAGDAESGGTSVVKFSYTALDGNTYYYYIGFRFYDEDEGGLCVTGDTLIMLADGSQKRFDALTGNEELQVWNHTTGSFDTAPVAYIVDHNSEIYQQEIYHLYFSDGSDLKIIGEHVFFDATLNKYVTLDENAENYVGHTFVGVSDGSDALTAIQLTDVVTEYEETAVYEVVSYEHLTCFANGILSASAYMDKLLNIFDIDPETMAYTPEKVQSDIETYGLYTYADFEGLIEEEAFELYNAKYLKIAVGKGYITWDDILDLIDIYFNVGVTPLQ